MTTKGKRDKTRPPPTSLPYLEGSGDIGWLVGNPVFLTSDWSIHMVTWDACISRSVETCTVTNME